MSRRGGYREHYNNREGRNESFRHPKCRICQTLYPTHAPDRCPKMKCFVCSEWGHRKEWCPTQVCFHCGEKGHMRSVCQNLPKSKNPRSTKPSTIVSKAPLLKAAGDRVITSSNHTVIGKVSDISELLSKFKADIAKTQAESITKRMRELDDEEERLENEYVNKKARIQEARDRLIIEKGRTQAIVHGLSGVERETNRMLMYASGAPPIYYENEYVCECVSINFDPVITTTKIEYECTTVVQNYDMYMSPAVTAESTAMMYQVASDGNQIMSTTELLRYTDFLLNHME